MRVIQRLLKPFLILFVGGSAKRASDSGGSWPWVVAGSGCQCFKPGHAALDFVPHAISPSGSPARVTCAQ
jgi:hypothetical protein